MGAASSDEASLQAEEISDLQAHIKLSTSTELSENELASLYQRFRQLDRNNHGTLARDDFLAIPELAMNPLAARVVELLGASATERVTFARFACTMGALRASEQLSLIHI